MSVKYIIYVTCFIGKLMKITCSPVSYSRIYLHNNGCKWTELFRSTGKWIKFFFYFSVSFFSFYPFYLCADSPLYTKSTSSFLTSIHLTYTYIRIISYNKTTRYTTGIPRWLFFFFLLYYTPLMTFVRNADSCLFRTISVIYCEHYTSPKYTNFYAINVMLHAQLGRHTNTQTEISFHFLRQKSETGLLHFVEFIFIQWWDILKGT